MKLVNMTPQDFELWSVRSTKSYAEDKMKANGYTRKEAEEIAKNDFNRLLPEGIKSKDNYLYTMKNQNSENIGYIWFGVRGSTDNRKAFICDIIVEENHRGQGYGKKSMLLLEEEAEKLGLNEIGLHVFGFNETAIGLYKSLGYQVTDLVMAKGLKN